MRKILIGLMLFIAMLFVNVNDASAQGPIRRAVGAVAYRVTHPFNGYFANRGCGCSNGGCNNNCSQCPTGQCPTTQYSTVQQNFVVQQNQGCSGNSCPNGVCPNR